MTMTFDLNVPHDERRSPRLKQPARHRINNLIKGKSMRLNVSLISRKLQKLQKLCFRMFTFKTSKDSHKRTIEPPNLAYCLSIHIHKMGNNDKRLFPVTLFCRLPNCKFEDLTEIRNPLCREQETHRTTNDYTISPYNFWTFPLSTSVVNYINDDN